MALTTGDKKWIKDSMVELLDEFHEKVVYPAMERLIEDKIK